jgi:hypothetical protein
MRRAVRDVGERLPHGWSDLLKQVGLFALANFAYESVRGIADGQQEVAFAHGRQIIDFEASTGTLFEPHLQALVLPYHWLIDVANQIYLNSQFAISISFLIWLYLFRNEAFYFVRNMFMMAMGLALVGYMAFPTAPPRMLPEWGFADTVVNWVGGPASNAASVLYNPYAAVPSMHVAFALMIAVPCVKLVRHRALKVLWTLYPVLITFVVLVTANHFWIDAVLGAMVAAASATTAAAAFARARPDAWAWRTARAEATI